MTKLINLKKVLSVLKESSRSSYNFRKESFNQQELENKLRIGSFTNLVRNLEWKVFINLN